ncbi:hypothetical protein ACP4OV_019326 [Aristida adscensionis]
MASDSDQPPPKRRWQPAAAPSLTTILDLEENLLLEIFLRLPSLPTLVRAALACRPFLAAVRASPAFRRRFRARRPLPLLGFFFESSGLDIPHFTPLRRRADPDLAAAVRGADVFLTRLPAADDASPGWEIEECHAGYALLINRSTDQLAAYNPLTRALHLLPMPPAQISAARRGKLSGKSFFVLSSDEAPGSFRVVSFCHDRARARAAVFSSATAQWQILPWSEPCPAPQPGKRNRFAWGRHVSGNLYWPHAKKAYQVVLDTAALQFSFIDLPEQLKGRNDLFMTGETKDGELCIVSAVGFKLYLWFRTADAEGVEKWAIDDVIPLEREILQATADSDEDEDDVGLKIKVCAVLEGTVYFTTLRARAYAPCWFLSFCLETRKLEKLFHRTFYNAVYPYIMAWPPALVGNQVSP